MRAQRSAGHLFPGLLWRIAALDRAFSCFALLVRQASERGGACRERSQFSDRRERTVPWRSGRSAAACFSSPRAICMMLRGSPLGLSRGRQAFPDAAAAAPEERNIGVAKGYGRGGHPPTTSCRAPVRYDAEPRNLDARMGCRLTGWRRGATDTTSPRETFWSPDCSSPRPAGGSTRPGPKAVLRQRLQCICASLPVASDLPGASGSLQPADDSGGQSPPVRQLMTGDCQGPRGNRPSSCRPRISCRRPSPFARRFLPLQKDIPARS